MPDRRPDHDSVEMTNAPAGTSVVILADDLIWATRLASLVRAAGASAISTRDAATFATALRGRRHTIVDLTARDYDGLAAVALAAQGGCSVLCVAQHDASELRDQARRAGAVRVLAYRALYEGGPVAITTWLSLPIPGRETPSAPATR